MASAGEPSSLWDEALRIPDLPRDVLNRLVYEHLVHHCYAKTAHAFAVSCKLTLDTNPATAVELSKPAAAAMEIDADRTDTTAPVVAPPEQPKDTGDVDMMEADDSAASSPVKPSPSASSSLPVPPIAAAKPAVPSSSELVAALRSMDTRKHVYALLAKGAVADAIAVCQSVYPAVLAGATPQSLDICFQVKCQQFIELVRTSAPDAVRFAQSELGQFGALGQKYLEVLQDVVALIAYRDPLSSPVAGFLSQERREEVATNVNNYILALENLPTVTRIERAAAQLVAVSDALHEQSTSEKKAVATTPNAAPKPVFPKWSFEEFVGP
ncbi:hypothetical protein HDU96_006363 [Phlyctochytrium bullatum]|nr:hypothetical protein HDU96_006363 [Phlyctochytrium bullatum]